MAVDAAAAMEALQQQLAGLQAQLDQQRTAQAAAAQDAATTAVNAVETLQLPAFWPIQPDDWFAVIEATFATRRITAERTRYMHVLQKLPPDTIANVRDIIRQQDTLANPYTRLKEKLTNTYGRSKYQLCDELYDMPALGAEKPSVLMAKMLALVPEGDTVGTWFHALFLRRLPEWMRRQLKAGDHTDTDALAAAADLLWEDRGANINAAAHAEGGRKKQHRGRSQGRGDTANWRRRSPGRSPSPRQSRLLADYPSGDPLCPFHWAFGRRAHKCKPPCSFQEN